MKAADTDAWQGRRAAITADGEVGQTFLQFLETWAENAEVAMFHSEIGPAVALRKRLQYTELQLGRCESFMLGQMIAVLAEHWKHGKKMMADLTPIERRLVEDMLIVKVAYEQQKAQQGDTHGAGISNQNGGPNAGPLAEVPDLQSGGQDATGSPGANGA